MARPTHETADEFLSRMALEEDWQDAEVGSLDRDRYAMQQRGGYRPEGVAFEDYALDKARGKTPAGQQAPLCRKERQLIRGVIQEQRIALLDLLQQPGRDTDSVSSLALDIVQLDCAAQDRMRWYRDSRFDR